MKMEFQTIQTEVSQGIARLILNRPERMNSFNQQMHQEVQQVIRQWVNDDEIRVIILTGNGKAFSSGQDLQERVGQLEHIALPSQGTLAKYYNPLVELIRQAPKPIIAAVNGVAAGAGANIALACDLVVAKQSAHFVQAFCKIGLIPDAGGTWMLPRLVGYAKAMGLTLLGEPINASHAEQMGMIWKALPDDEFDAYIEQLAQHFSKQPTYGLALIKQAMQQSAVHSYEQQLEVEKNLQYLASHTEDYKEGVRAFVEKRTTQFKGH